MESAGRCARAKPVTRQKVRAFTLFETMLALALLTLLVGGLFALVQGSVKATVELHQRQSRHQELMALFELCERTFRSLPANASFETKVREEDGKEFVEIIFREAPQAFAWGKSPPWHSEAILSVRPQVGGLVNISLLHSERTAREDIDTSEDAERLRWLVLVSDLKKVQWRFYDSRTSAWMEGWREAGLHPSLVELTLTPAGDAEPIRSVFWLPPLQRN